MLRKMPGVKVFGDPVTLTYPTPLNVTGQFDVEVGRIRQIVVYGDRGLECSCRAISCCVELLSRQSSSQSKE